MTARSAGAQVAGCKGSRRDVSWELHDESKWDDDKAELRGSGSAGVFEVGTATDALGNEGQVAGWKAGKRGSCVYNVIVAWKTVIK